MIILDGNRDLLQILDLEIAGGLILWWSIHAMNGLRFISTLERVPVLYALVNPSWHLMPGGAPVSNSPLSSRVSRHRGI
jgi:hypothetical protein